MNANDSAELRRFIPLNTMSATRFESLCAEIEPEETSKGNYLFRQGDTDTEFVYLLSGAVTLQAGDMELETVTGGSDSAKFAIAHQIPRKVSALAREKVRFVRIPAHYINQATEKKRGLAGYEVNDLPRGSSGDWMTTLLRSPIFQRVPAANLQKILLNLQEIRVKANDQVIRQDDPGDYYYVIKEGRCQVSRRPSPNARDIKLGELKTCDTFGEDSLLSGEPRNVSVTMLTDGVLLRLNRESFIDLVKEHVLAYVDFESAQRIKSNNGVLLDIRAPDAFTQCHLPDSTNIPFFSLRMLMSTLSRQHRHVVICEDSRISAAAAFLLIRHGIDAVVLEGGIEAVPGAVHRAAPVERMQTTVEPRLTEPAEHTPPPDQAASHPPAPSATARTTSEIRHGMARAEPALPSDGPMAGVAAQRVAPMDPSNLLQGVHSSDPSPDVAAWQSNSPDRRPSPDLLVLTEQLQSAQQEVAELRSRVSSATAEPPSATLVEAQREAAAARAQVEELRALVQEFIDQQASGSGSDLAALQKENETIRLQAERDVLELQKQLRDAKDEIARWHNDSPSSQQSSTEQQPGLTAARTVDRDLFSEFEAVPSKPVAKTDGNTVRSLPMALAFLSGGVVFSAATWAAVLFTEPGHHWFEQLQRTVSQNGVPGEAAVN